MGGNDLAALIRLISLIREAIEDPEVVYKPKRTKQMEKRHAERRAAKEAK